MLTANETQFTLTSTLVPITCYLCGIVFGLEREFKNRRINDHEPWHCPNGHSQVFSGKTEAERLREQLAATERCLTNSREETQRQRELRQQTERSLRGTKAVVTRMKRRTVKGQCVCCSKKFKDLETHMKTEHPDWNPDRAAEVLGQKTA
jgi:hypothetical protein